ncbi:serine protein kinase [Thermus scotoductus]|uniref:Serine protein kinase n=1 Tax=Thermus scotoductus TaxID=37636 RepID=A0A430S6Z6_THESC|nr:serine protein kinase [Thermus scotoductus]RTG96963.1 serine protein kinase [Thermus scotoductus]RTH09612.1 serine protein kinase [Thermus scotoductus]RTH13328.1 serine protein kinase [Thermus scotoductus]RTH14043.1 serine protein kinase [Thermus scotoductus]RTH20036.1 serine protein kinase [Thermus scotoductus]
MNELERIRRRQDLEAYRALSWEGSFADYLGLLKKDPRPLRTSFQRVHDMILSYGVEEYTLFREKLLHYRFFEDPFEGGKDAIFGLDKPLMRLVATLKAAAHRLGPERRILLLHGPVGSAKSTIARLLKKGLEAYSRTEEGKLFTFYWKTKEGPLPCPMHEEPLLLLPKEIRNEFLEELRHLHPEYPYPLELEGDLCPVCRFQMREALARHGGDLAKVLEEEIVVKRLVLSEKDRIGIGTFQPKDEKNQDSTELTGDINYRKVAIYGSDSDPRAFNFDGELNIANRGLVEFIEILKLDVAFLYDLLTASQEHKIKSKKFAQTDIDEIILGHTNEPEYRKLQANEYMEALRDRTIKIDVPYILRVSDEVKIYQRDFSKVRAKHIAPHTLEMAATWAVLTRLEPPKRAGLTLMQKLKLYDGKLLPGWTEEAVRELMAEAKREGLEGISPRYIQDKISNVLVTSEEPCINPFMVMNELEEGLKHHSLISDDKTRERYKALLQEVKAEYAEIVKNEVQRAIAADEEALNRLFHNYIDHVKAYVLGEKVKNPYTGAPEPPNERLMRSIEERIEIPESRKDDFRREIMNYIGALALEGRQFTYKDNERLRRALELKLFDDQKDTIRLSALVSGVVDPETQAKIDVVKARLIRDHGYCEHCASGVLEFAASIFARGER